MRTRNAQDLRKSTVLQRRGRQEATGPADVNKTACAGATALRFVGAVGALVRDACMARVVFFAFDIAEAAQLRRIESLRALGHDVASVSFRRESANGTRPLDWPDVRLGPSSHRRYFLRLWRLARAVLLLRRNGAVLEAGDVWIARNLDMAVLALILRARMRRSDVRVVYECLDIHGMFTRAGPLGAAMRWAERQVLGRADLMIVSSPGFLKNYFHPIQKISTPVALVENKLWVSGAPPVRPACPRRRSPQAPFVLGWVGSLRCARSLALLAELAATLGDRVRIECHGAVHRHAVPDFDTVIAAHANMHYRGPYSYPDDLCAIYTGCDAVWAQDLWQSGANSDWLLPNRIYEASYFGCPSIALQGTETGHRVGGDGLGFVVDAPSAEALGALIAGLDPGATYEASARLLARPDHDFRLTCEDLAGALAPILAAHVPKGAAAAE